MTKLSYCAITIGVIAALFAIIDNSASLTTLAVGLTLAGIEVIVLTRAAGGFSPIVLPILSINTVLLSSLFFWDELRRVATVSIALNVTEEYLIQAAAIGIAFSSAFTVGALLAGPRSATSVLRHLGSSITQIGNSLRLPDGVLLTVGYGAIAMVIYGKQGALLHGQYLESQGPGWAVSLGNALTPVALFALCIVSVRRGPLRMAAIVGLGVLMLILFGRATRSIAIFPALLLLARTIVTGRRVRPITLAIAAGSSVLLMQLAIVGRADEEVGIIPLGTHFLTNTGDFFATFKLSSLFGNVLFAGPLTAVVANRPMPNGALWVSVNPLPGGWVGWPEMQRALRIDRVTPYNALGELGAHGWVAVIVVAVATGFALSLTTRLASSLNGVYAMTAVMLTVAMMALFSVTILQYNLRSTLRLVWYTVFGVSAIWYAQGLLARMDRRPFEYPVVDSSAIPLAAETKTPEHAI